MPFRWNHNMESLEQTADGVKVRFANGVVEEGSFVVGCDGLHSNVRKALFGAEKADYTGLACVRFTQSLLANTFTYYPILVRRFCACARGVEGSEPSFEYLRK